MTENRPKSDHGAPGPKGAPRDIPDEPDEITHIASELEREHERRKAAAESAAQDDNFGAPPPSNPYFIPQETPTVEVKALRPLSDVFVSPFVRPPENESVALEPASDDNTLNEAILTKRLPLPPKPEPQPKVTMEEIESIVAEIPDAAGSDTEIRKVLPQSKVIEDPGLLVSEADLLEVRARLERGLLQSLFRALRDRVDGLLAARASVPFDHDYYSLRSVGGSAYIIDNPSLLEAAFIGRVANDPATMQWALEALRLKCTQNGGVFHDRAGAAAEALPGRGCVTAIRDVALAADLLSPVMKESDRAEVGKALYENGRRLAKFITDPAQNPPPGTSETGAMALGLAALPLMNFEAYYQNARRWVDTAEARAQTLLINRVADNGRPAASDLNGLTDLMRFLVPFCEAFKRYYGDDMLMGEGGNLSQLPRWIAHQFGADRYGLFSSGRLKVDDLRGATPLLAKIADTYRHGVAQWLLQQVGIAEAAKRVSEEDRISSKYRLELPANPGIDAVLTAAYYDPTLQPTSPEQSMSPGARLSETRAVIRADWAPGSTIVTLQAELGALPYVQLASAGVNLKLLAEPELYQNIGGREVAGRVRDYIDMGGAAYINGDFKGTDGSLAQRHLLYLRTEGSVLLFDRFDIGDGRSLQRAGLRIGGGGEARPVDRGTLQVNASDGSGRAARFIFYSNGFSQGVELSGPGNGLPGLTLEFLRGRGDLAGLISIGNPEQMPPVRRINTDERGRVYRTTMGDGAVLFNGWQGGMPQQCGWIWTDALMAFVDRRDDYPGRYVAIKATSVLAYDMSEGLYLGFGASHPDDPNKPVEFSLCASGPQAVLFLSTRAHVRVSFPGLKKVLVDGAEVEIEGDSKVFVIAHPLEPGRHLIEFEHESPGPESSIITPREDQFVGGAFQLQASIGDPIGVAKARLLIDGRPWGAPLTQSPWIWKVDGRELAEGPHEAVIEATDVLDHVRRSKVRSFRVDNTPPAVELNEPHDGKKTRGILTFVATAEDHNGVERVQFCLNGKKVGEPVTTPPYTRDIDTTQFDDGQYMATAIAFDAAGNVGHSEGARLLLANDAPPPEIVKLKITPPVLAVQPLQEVQLETIGIDDEDNEHPVRVQWRRLKGQGVVDKNNIFTAPGTEGPCVMEAQVVGTTVRAKLHAVVSRE
jgi:hypothetical protein